ncbi:MAG TPA: hypothetical protein VJJ54_04855 [Gemmatimonadales bacterium]|nr:hypothetical protein [Gemmatimonadales bacterium]
MKSFAVLALIALVAGCRLETFFTGSGGGAPPVAGPPSGLGFTDQPQTTRARKTLPPVRVAVRDDQGNVVSRFGGLVALTIDSNPGGVSLGDTTTVAAANGIATFRHLRIDKAGTGYRLVASAPGTALAPVKSQAFAILAPLTGNLTVTTNTAGADLPGGYTVSVDDSISQPIGINAVVTFIGVAAGSHVVTLAGVTPSCSVGTNPETVSVSGGETALASFAISCAAPPPTTGEVVVTTATSGSSLPSGYTASFDGGPASPIGINDSVTATGIAAGQHTVALSGVPGNCTVASPNPQTVTVAAGSTARAAFTIGCAAATGSLTVTTTTTGSNFPAGYTVTLDTGQSGTIGANDSVTATGIPTGDHMVTLSGVPGNCTLATPNPLAVTVTAGTTTQAGFTISCTGAGP